MRETYGWSRQRSWLVVLLLGLMLGAGDAAAAEPKQFTLMNVALDGTKIWLPSSLVVHQGEEVELTLINKLDDPHGFKIEEFGIEEVVQPKPTGYNGFCGSCSTPFIEPQTSKFSSQLLA